MYKKFLHKYCGLRGKASRIHWKTYGKLNILPIFLHKNNLKRIMIKLNPELVVKEGKQHCTEHSRNNFGNSYGELTCF